MSDTPSIWFRIGYALERARQEPLVGKLEGLRERRNGRGTRPKDRERRDARQRSGEDAPEVPAPREDALDALLTAGAGAVAAKLVGLVPARRSPGVLGLLRAGAAGAGAALLRELLDPLLRGEKRLAPPGPESAEAAFAGAARGLLYGAVLEPRLPGPAAVRGVLYGSLEYAVSPWGGLTSLLGERAPHRRIPLVKGLFEDYALGEDSYLDHLAFGVALALLYGAPLDEPPYVPESSGTEADE
jgi:hypothetical protein